LRVDSSISQAGEKSFEGDCASDRTSAAPPAEPARPQQMMNIMETEKA
jgi:hypothetical protein